MYVCMYVCIRVCAAKQVTVFKVLSLVFLDWKSFKECEDLR